MDGTNGIIAGHGRLLAARKLGFKEVPTIELADLTEIQRKAYVIADNRLALNAEWDNQLLTLELNELLADGFAMDILGFDSEEISKLLDEPDFQPATEEEQGKLDELDPKWIACPHCGKEFDARQA